MKKILILSIFSLNLQSCGVSPRMVYGYKTVEESFEKEKEADFPNRQTGIDIVTHTPSDSFESGKGKTASDKRYGTDARFPACPLAVSLSPLTEEITIDGELSEWNTKGKVSFDRSGDGYSSLGGADLISLSVSETTDATYLAITLAEEWAGSTENEVKMFIDFNKITADNGNVTLENKARFIVRDDFKLFDNAEYPNSVDASLHSMAKSGTSIEFKFSKKGSLQEIGNTYEISVYVGKTTDETNLEKMGSYIAGIVNDYGCLVKMPDGSKKLFAFGHYPGLSSGSAEIAYRAFLSAASESVALATDDIDFVDTVNVNIVPQVSESILSTASGGIYFQSGEIDPRNDFLRLGYGYMTLISQYDYRVITNWASEGFAHWVALGAARNFFGDALWKAEFDSFYRHIDEVESSQGIKPLAAGSDPSFDIKRAKSTLLTEFITANSSFNDLKANLDRRASPGSAVSDDTGLKNAIVGLLEAKGVPNLDKFWLGWIDFGEYGAGPVSPSDYENYFGL